MTSTINNFVDAFKKKRTKKNIVLLIYELGATIFILKKNASIQPTLWDFFFVIYEKHLFYTLS